MKTLIVEDESTSLKIVTAIMKPYGEVVTTKDGEDAFVLFSDALTSGQKFDLICLDLHLEETDGNQFLYAVRELEEQNGIVGSEGVKVIIVTSSHEAQDAYDSFSAGCNAFINKPVSKEEFLTQLNRIGALERK